jgi:transcriptional regulator with XRE-family HTH domain
MSQAIRAGDLMPSNRRSPAVARRQLKRKLRQARQSAQMTQNDVATGLDWSVSKVLRIENAQVSAATSDLIALAAFFKLPEPMATELVDLARIARQPSPNTTYRDVLTNEFADWLEHEAYASRIQQYETKFVPGVLQTFDYADSIVRALLGRVGRSADEEKANRIVSARLDRAAALLAPDGPPMSYILDEAVIRRGVGNERGKPNFSIMLEQLEQLKRLNTRGRRERNETIESDLNPNVAIQILPFEFGAYQAMRGPFELLEFEEPDEDNMIYFEYPDGDSVIRDTHSESAPYADLFSEMQTIATKAANLDGVIDRVIELINEGNNGIVQ